MPRTQTLRVELPAELVAEVRRVVADGDYGSEDDVISDALLAWSHGRAETIDNVEWLKQAVREADEDDRPAQPMEEVMDRLEAKYKALYGETSRAKQCA
jgi:Arc/MetJ-type ribon-helix-helix transcriptional regulator